MGGTDPAPLSLTSIEPDSFCGGVAVGEEGDVSDLAVADSPDRRSHVLDVWPAVVEACRDLTPHQHATVRSFDQLLEPVAVARPRRQPVKPSLS